MKGSGTTYPEPGVVQLPARAHFFGSKGDRVTRICDGGAGRLTRMVQAEAGLAK